MPRTPTQPGPRYDPGQFDSPPHSTNPPGPGQRLSRLQQKLRQAQKRANRFDRRHADVERAAGVNVQNPFDQRAHKLRNKVGHLKFKDWRQSMDALYNNSPDSQYNSEIAAADATRQNALGNLYARGVMTQAAYGLDAGYNDPTSALYNPNNRAAQLESAWQNQFRATGNSMAARGQLYSGAMDNARSIDDATAQQQLAALQAEHDQAIAALNADAGAANTAYHNAEATAGQGLTDRNAAAIADATQAGAPRYVKRERQRIKHRIQNVKKGKEGKKQKAQLQRLKHRLQETRMTYHDTNSDGTSNG